MSDKYKKTDVPRSLDGLVRFLNRRAVFFYLGLLSFFFLSVIGGGVFWVADYVVWEIANKSNNGG